ncbi:MAG: septation protein IspZ [Chitinophagaceae bacterium]|nr:septation protein IspZ [Oligoflexus sp.]
MNFGLLFFQFLPLLIYILVDYFKGFKAGILAAIGAALFMLVWDYATTGTIDQFSLGESFLIVLLGVISLKMDNERFFKFQPTVTALVIAGVFAFFEFRGEPLMIRYIPQMEKIFAGKGPATGDVKVFLDHLHDPQMLKTMARLSRAMIFLFLGHAAIMAYAALFWSTGKWFAWRLAVYPGLCIVTMVVAMTS